MFARLQALKALRGKFANGGELARSLRENNELRSEIDSLARIFLRRRVTGCINCYTDAFFELIMLDEQKAKDIMNTQFELKAGALLKDANDRSKNMTNVNCTDELALWHLKNHPESLKLFVRVPDNLAELLAEPKAVVADEPQVVEQTATPKAKKAKRKK